MKIIIPKPFAYPIAISSFHGFTDLQKDPTYLTAYVLALLPVPERITTTTFMCSSLYHFSNDIGILKSFLLHTFWVVGFKYYKKIAWLVFCLFYCGVHVPMTLYRHPLQLKYTFVSLLFLKFIKKEGMFVNELLQKFVISHVFIDYLSNKLI